MLTSKKRLEIKNFIEEAVNEYLENDDNLKKLQLSVTVDHDNSTLENEISGLRNDIKALRETLGNAIQEWRPVSMVNTID